MKSQTLKEQDKLKTKEDILLFIKAYIFYRGGMGNRISAFDIEDFLEGKRKREYKSIKKTFEKWIKDEKFKEWIKK